MALSGEVGEPCPSEYIAKQPRGRIRVFPWQSRLFQRALLLLTPSCVSIKVSRSVKHLSFQKHITKLSRNGLYMGEQNKIFILYTWKGSWKGTCNKDGFGEEIAIFEALSPIFFLFYFIFTVPNYCIAFHFCDTGTIAHQYGLLNVCYKAGSYFLQQNINSCNIHFYKLADGRKEC